ncbi:MAG: efflux RND transporter periplasmic adaptor subunit [Pelolinea sp.]|nr:efflux RND transporter periplasmic adaptor subunit [Pelolinea sp.]
MVKKKEKKSGAVAPEKTKVVDMVVVLFKKRPYIVVGGAVLILVLIFILVNVFGPNNNIDGDYQTAIVTRGDLIAIVGATGIVEANQSSELNWETTGRVEVIYVSVNDSVEGGDVLAELADNTLPQSVILAQADLVTAQRALGDLVSSNTESALAYTDLLEAEQQLRDAEDERDQWNYNDASDERVSEARAEFLRVEEDFKAEQLTYDKFANIDDSDPQKIQAQASYEEVKLERDKALRALNYILGKSYDQQVAEDYADYDVAFAQLEDAQRAWDRVKDGPNADDIKAAEAKVAAAEATVSLGRIEAPFSGTVTKAEPRVGDEVKNGTSGFRIDDLSELFVDVEISEVDINRIVVGQKAELSFDAIIGETFTGNVVEVSSVGIENGSGVDFLVTLKIVDPSEQVRPGMTAAVNIVVSEIKNVLAIPNRAVRLKENERVIYLLKDGEIQEVTVKFGSSSDVSSEIISGEVEEGDLVVLNPPMEFATHSGPPAFVR